MSDDATSDDFFAQLCHMSQLPPLVGGVMMDDNAAEADTDPVSSLPMPHPLSTDAQGQDTLNPSDDVQPPVPVQPDDGDDQAEAPQGRVAVSCPFCFAPRTVNLGGSTRGLTYAYMCETCTQVWTQLREPDANGDLRIRLSKRAVNGKPRRSGGYKCGVCGQAKQPQPGVKHVCPGYRVTDDAGDDDSQTIGPLMSAIQADAQAALAASSSVINASQSPMPAAASDSLWDNDVVLPGVDAMAAPPPPVSKPPPVVATPIKPLPPVPAPPAPSVPAPSPAHVPAVHTGTDLFKLLRLVNKKVKGDGSCWDYAIMACAGLCDHAHLRQNKDPSPKDRSRDALCRVMTHTYLQTNGVMLNLSASELANLDDILEMPKYPMKEDDDFGSFGSNLTVLGLVGFIKKTVVMWNNLTIDVIDAKQQVISWSGVKPLEFNMTPSEILKNEPDAIHILWNGSNHYTAMVAPVTVRFDEPVHMLLANAVSIPQAPAKRRLADDAGNWVCLTNMIRTDPVAVEIVENGDEMSARELKKICLDKGFNTILHIMDTGIVRLMRFDFTLTMDDCDRAGDFNSNFYIYTPTKKKMKKTAPCTTGCTCGYHYIKAQTEVSCGKCGRWIHQMCTPHADMTPEELDAVEFVCTECE